MFNEKNIGKINSIIPLQKLGKIIQIKKENKIKKQNKNNGMDLLIKNDEHYEVMYTTNNKKQIQKKLSYFIGKNSNKNENNTENEILNKNKLSNYLIRDSFQGNFYYIQTFDSKLKKSNSEKKFKKNILFDKKDNIKKNNIILLFKNKSKSNDKKKSNNKIFNIENYYCLTENNYLRGGRINLITSNNKNYKTKKEKNYDFNNNINMIIKIQSRWRKYMLNKYIKKIIIIQKFFRSYTKIKNLKKMKKNIIYIQRIIRRFLQIKKLKKIFLKKKIENGCINLDKIIKNILFRKLINIIKKFEKHISNNINDSTDFNSIDIPEENIYLKDKIYYLYGDDNVFGNKINIFQVNKTKFKAYLNESNEVFIDDDFDNNIRNTNNDTDEFSDCLMKKINIYNYSNHINYVKNNNINNKNTNNIKENKQYFNNKKKVTSLFGRKIKKYIKSSENSNNKHIHISNDLICNDNKSTNIIIVPNGLNYEVKRNNSKDKNNGNSLLGYIKSNNNNYSKLTSSKLKDFLSKKKIENGNNINKIKTNV